MIRLHARVCSLHRRIPLSEVQKNIGAELVYNDIVGPNLERHPICSQIPPHNAVRDEFGTSLFMNFGKANYQTANLSFA